MLYLAFQSSHCYFEKDKQNILYFIFDGGKSWYRTFFYFALYFDGLPISILSAHSTAYRGYAEVCRIHSAWYNFVEVTCVWSNLIILPQNWHSCSPRWLSFFFVVFFRKIRWLEAPAECNRCRRQRANDLLADKRHVHFGNGTDRVQAARSCGLYWGNSQWSRWKCRCHLLPRPKTNKQKKK